MAYLVHRPTALASIAGGEWADVYISNVSTIGAQLATSGRKVGVSVGSSFTGLSQQLTAGNGASMSIVPNGSFDGRENAVLVNPPTIRPNGGADDAGYACWLRFLDLWNNGTSNIYQMNFRVLVYYGPRYFDMASDAKCWGFLASTTLGTATSPNRVAVFDNRDADTWTNWKYPFVTVTTAGSYHQPPSGAYPDTGSDTNKLLSIRNVADHSINCIATAGEWICYEDMFDLRRDRGNPNGIHRLRAWTRDGVLNGRYLEIPLSWDGGWDFNRIYTSAFEGLGFYFNQAGSAHPDNYLMHSHATFAANMGINELIGPPPGYLL